MLNLGPLAFAAPWLLLALAALPALWWLLRVTPPAPRRIAFPAIRLLRDLPTGRKPCPHPWWLLLLRLLAAALVVLGLARPVLGPGGGAGGEGSLLLVVDDGWAAAADWPARMAAASATLERAAREGRRAALLPTAPAETGDAPRLIGPMPAEDLRARLAALRPKPWPPDRAAALAAFAAWHAGNPGPLTTLLVSDGVAHGPEAGRLPAALAAAGRLSVALAEARPHRLLPPPVAEADRLRIRVQQVPIGMATEAGVLARTGDGRALARADVPIPADAASGEATLELPLELRNQVVRLEIEGETGAGGVVLLDERFRRRPVGLLPGAEDSADAPLIGELFYLDRALAPFTELRRAPLDRLLSRPIAVLALADRPVPEGPEREALTRWVEQGGTLLRFAGPRLAEHPDPLLPVPLRAERQLGGALSWEQPQRLAPSPRPRPSPGCRSRPR
ncbi:BatA domain-containing protein [Siccirubricoccus deserti]